MVSFFTRNKPAPKDQNQSKATPETPSSQEAPADLTNSAATTHTTTTVGDMQLLNTVWDNTRTRSAVISEAVSKNTNAILKNDSSQTFRYFLMELIRKNSGVTTLAVQIDRRSSWDIVTATLPGRYKDDNSVYKLLLDNNAQIKDTLCIRDHVIVLGNIELSLNKFGSSELAFSIPKNLKESDLELVRVFFEEKFLKEFMINNKELFTEEAVRRYLCLEDSDSLLFHDQRMQIIIRPKSKPSFTPEALEKFIQELNNHFEEYSVRRTPDTLLFSRLFTDWQQLTAYNTKNQIPYQTTMKWDDSSITVEIPSKTQLDIKYVQNFLKFYTQLLRNHVQNWNNVFSQLRASGILVEEQDPSQPKKSLDELYVSEHFLGYTRIKEYIETNVIFPWLKRDEYKELWRQKFPHARNMIPNSVLFEGGPGTGKTTEAKIIGKYLGYPFIYIPVGKIVSKWYGESEKKLDTILELARKAGEQYGGVVVMIDEIDEIGLNRDSAHEATGRITGVLLKKLDGMEKIDNLLLIGSTNRMTSMDPALLSRFSQIINFPVPAREDIRCIFQHYIPDAASVLDEVLMKLENRSWREIQNIANDIICQYARESIIHKKEGVDMSDLIIQTLNALNAASLDKPSSPRASSEK